MQTTPALFLYKSMVAEAPLIIVFTWAFVISDIEVKPLFYQHIYVPLPSLYTPSNVRVEI